jgi:putative nucleotidyltransferase with HDIG domain
MNSELFGSGIFSGMLTIALLPYFEETFNILTKLKLIELGDLSHPLLRKMALEAPGTFNHSMLVATLSEQAAECIGADSTFTRVACYYHDIGKMKRPNFYVENQHSGINPHDNLSPTLSTMIIKAHTKDGQEMGKKYKIPKEIRDIMAEHQGTTLLAYFYNKVKKDNPDINESDFRYDGPKPKTKESAIIMLADSIEAAVRSMDEKNPIEVEKMIRRIIGNKMDDAQLSDADLTLKEIELIINSFVKTFQGVYHSRIKYPGQK